MSEPQSSPVVATNQPVSTPESIPAPIGFKCPKCFLDFKTKNAFEKHVQSCKTIGVLRYFATESLINKGDYIQGMVKIPLFLDVIAGMETNGYKLITATSLHNRQILVLFRKG